MTTEQAKIAELEARIRELEQICDQWEAIWKRINDSGVLKMAGEWCGEYQNKTTDESGSC